MKTKTINKLNKYFGTNVTKKEIKECKKDNASSLEFWQDIAREYIQFTMNEYNRNDAFFSKYVREIYENIIEEIYELFKSTFRNKKISIKKMI